MFDLSRYLKITDRDRASTLIQHYSEVYASVSNQQMLATAHQKIPKDRILIITSWHILPNSGNMGTSDYCRFYVETSTGVYENLESYSIQMAAGVLPQIQDYFISKEHIIIGGDAPYAEMWYSSGAAVDNSIESRVRGFMIPKGTLSGF